MKLSERNKFLALMSFHLLWGFVLWFSISKLGLGISTDSVHLMFGGTNLAETGRLVSFDGSPLLQWPPLYPVLLAGVHLLTGLTAFTAAHLLQAAAYAGLAVCTSLLFLRMFPDNFGLALVGNVLTDTGVVVVAGFDLLGSDYVHLSLVVLCLLLTAHYVDTNSPRAYVALAVTGMLAALDRYIGIAAIGTGVVSILWMAGGSRRERLVRGIVLSSTALPAGIWLLLTSPLIERRAPLSFAENIRWFTLSLAEWFLPASVVGAHPVRALALLTLIVLSVAAMILLARRTGVPPYAKPVLLFGALYVLALFGSASIAYFNKLGGRFLLPLYIPFITLLLVGAQGALSAALRRSSRLSRAAAISVYGWLAIVFLLALRVSAPVMMDSHAEASDVSENAFNTAQWHTNAAIRYWIAHKPKGRYALFSNYPDAVAFYTQHACSASPRRYSGPYGNVEFPVEGYAGQLFPPGQVTYLIWIEPNGYDYYYSPDDLLAIADVRPLFESLDGAVYQLSPKAGG